MTNEEIELRHIQLELQNGRSQHLRHFIDQYFCYKEGYVSRNGRSKWSLMYKQEWVSINAEEIDDKKLLVEKEDIVPLKLITKKLKALGTDCTIKQIRVLIDKYLYFATITKEEDAILSKHGLRQKMPDEFFEEKSELYEDVFARYKKVGILVKKAN